MAIIARKPSRFIGVIFTLFGLIFIGAGGALTYSTFNFMNNAMTTTGQVISVDSNSSDGGTTYKPTFAYVDNDGQQRQGTTFLSSSSYDFQVGSKMDILYDSRDFSAVRLTGWFNTWGFGILFMAAGVVPILIGRFIRKIAKSNTPSHRRPKHDEKRAKYVQLESPESEEDHRRETEYKPTVRRN